MLSKKLKELLIVTLCDKKLANELTNAIENAAPASILKVQKGTVKFTAGQHITDFDTGITLPLNAAIVRITVKLKSESVDNFNMSNVGPYQWQFTIGGQNYQATSEAEFWTDHAVVTNLAVPFGTGMSTILPRQVAAGKLTISSADGSADPSAGPYDVDQNYDIWVEYFEGS